MSLLSISIVKQVSPAAVKAMLGDAGEFAFIDVREHGQYGEAHPLLSPNDEFANYETWDKSNLNGTEIKKPEMLQWEYAREALKTGLQLEQKLGVNPYKFGMVGSTDSHTSLSTAQEDNFFGKHSGVEPGPHPPRSRPRQPGLL